MNSIHILENNVVRSFQTVKLDILKLQTEISSISSTLASWSETINEILDQQREHIDEIDDLKRQISRLKAQQKAIMTIFDATEKKYVSSVSSKKIHKTDCVFAKNIKPSKRIYFGSRLQALKKGLEPCKCITT